MVIWSIWTLHNTIISQTNNKLLSWNNSIALQIFFLAFNGLCIIQTDIHDYKYSTYLRKLHSWLKVSSKSHAGCIGFVPVYQRDQVRFNVLGSFLLIYPKRSAGKNLSLFLIHFHACQSRLPLKPLFWLEYLSDQRLLHLHVWSWKFALMCHQWATIQSSPITQFTFRTNPYWFWSRIVTGTQYRHVERWTSLWV